MAWTAPRTWVTGEVVTASLMNTHVRDNLNYLKGAAGTIAFDAGATFAGSAVATAGGNNQGVLTALSGSSSVLAGIGCGRTASEVQMAIVASAAQFFSGSAAGDMILRDIDAAKKIMLGSGTTAVMTLAPGPAVGIGRTAPQGPLHVHDGVGGWLFWSGAIPSGTAITIIPDGAGDVTLGLLPIWAVVPSSGTSQGGAYSTGGTVLVTPGTTTNIYSAAGPNTVQLQVAANGAITVQRTAGTLTYTVALLLIWL